MKDILLNILFILVVLLISQLFLNSQRGKLSSKKEAFCIYVSGLISILFCMTFSIIVNEEYRVDLRAIPFILSGLYGGPGVSISLFASTTIFRLIFGLDGGFWGNTIIFALITILCILFTKQFRQSATRERMLIFSLITLSQIMLYYFIYNYVFVVGFSTSMFIIASLIQIASSSFVLLLSLAIVEPLAKMSSIEIQKNLTSFTIKGDESMLQQAFINIFKNAIEAMPGGGLLDIEMTADQEASIISIRDTGMGMNREQLERIGTPYYTTKGKNGTGLGLMVTFRIIQGVKGKIKVTSEVGKGTTFTITFPQSLFSISSTNLVDAGDKGTPLR